MAEKTKVETAAEGLTIFERFVEMVKKYGALKIILYSFVFVIFSYLTYIAATPQAMFERYDEYIAQKHAESNDYRMESSPIIRGLLNQLSMEINAERTYVIEYHNGKSNPSGLQWQYGDMTFLNDGADIDISGEFQNISLVRYPLFYELYENGIWVGNSSDLVKIDKRFALRMEANDVKYVGMITMFGNNLTEVGVLGVSFLNEEPIDELALKRTLTKYASSIAPLLDGSNAKK